MNPLAIDLFCGLGGWAEGFIAEGYDVFGFDNGHTAPYSAGAKYPGQLVIQDVLTLHGSQFRNATVIVASPPCQNYSYLAMPWSRSKSEHSQKAKAMRRKWETEGPDNRLFEACFRIQREAIEAAGRYIPLIVENVRGAIPWVGRSAWNYGSFHLWGDVPALMPIGGKRKGLGAGAPLENGTGSTSWFFTNRADPRDMRKTENGWANPRGEIVIGRADEILGAIHNDGSKGFTGGLGKGHGRDPARQFNSRSNARRMASAQIAKIPFPLANWIAQVYKPRDYEAVA